MLRLRLVPVNTRIPFISWRKLFFTFSLILIVGATSIFATKGLNYGIDFRGGILIDVQMTPAPDLGSLRSKLGGLGLGEVGLQTFGTPNDILIRVERQEGGEKAQQLAIQKIQASLGKDGVDYRRVEAVGPKVSSELLMDGVAAVGLAIIAMLIYIWFRFEWQFGLCAVIALVHDVLSTIGIFSLLGMEFNLTTVAAVLTIAGYSINDTVVVFDRVRENLRKYKTMALPELFDISINETLSRTTMTSFTTLLAVFTLYLIGGEVIRGFSFAMLWGIVVGTYSSICVAVPMLLYLNLRRGGTSGQEAAAPAAS